MSTSQSDAGMNSTALLDTLREVFDPEWPVSVVDLGLVRAVTVREGVVHVEMTFTSVGCPFVDSICDSVKQRLLLEPSVNDVVVDVTWRPWNAANMSPAAAKKFSKWGVAL